MVQLTNSKLHTRNLIHLVIKNLLDVKEVDYVDLAFLKSPPYILYLEFGGYFLSFFRSRIYPFFKFMLNSEDFFILIYSIKLIINLERRAIIF